MDKKIREKVFPKTEKSNDLKFDNEGLWSITHPNDAETISLMIKKFILDYKKCNPSDKTILEATAGLGGNIFSFSKHFKKVKGIEIDNNRFKMLEVNVSCYNLDNVELVNGNCINYLSEDFDIYFFDPPWGGPKYKSKESINIFLDKYNLNDIIKKISKNKIIVFKLPFNYNLNLLKEYDLVIKKLGNMLIVLLVS